MLNLAFSVQGVFPASYVRMKDALLHNPGAYESVTPADDPVARETAEVIREWSVLALNLFLVRWLLPVGVGGSPRAAYDLGGAGPERVGLRANQGGHG